MDRGQILQIHQRTGARYLAQTSGQEHVVFSLSLLDALRVSATPLINPSSTCLPLFHAATIFLGCAFNLCFVLNHDIPFLPPSPSPSLLSFFLFLFRASEDRVISKGRWSGVCVCFSFLSLVTFSVTIDRFRLRYRPTFPLPRDYVTHGISR